MSEQHLRDYVWMKLTGENPVKVPANTAEISRRMVAGYTQCDEPEAAPKKAKESK